MPRSPPRRTITGTGRSRARRHSSRPSGPSSRRERHRSRTASRRVVVTAGGNMAFVNAVLAVTDPGDEVILPAPFYFNHEMAIVMAGCRPVAVPTDARYQLRPDAIRARHHAAHARRRDHLAEQPERRGVPGAGAARGERAVRASTASTTSTTRRTSTSPTTARRTSRPARFDGAGRPHDLAVLAVEGVRLGQLADRLHGHPRAAVRGGQQDPGHEPDLPAARLAGRGAARRSAPGRLLPREGRRARRRAATWCWTQFARMGDAARVPRPDGAFYCLVRVQTAMDSAGAASSG